MKLADVRRAVAAGADEIDMVIDRGAFLAGDFRKVFDEIVATKDACLRPDGSARTSRSSSRRASSRRTTTSGAPPTSPSRRAPTSSRRRRARSQPAATPAVTLCMLEAIRDHWLATGVKIGMKPAGGIRTSEAGAPLPRPRQGDARRRLADAGPLPLRGVEPRQRPPHAAQEGRDGAVSLRRRVHEGLR